MAVKIKLKRLGKIRNPQYRIVVADARTKRDGRAIEEIGKYHPKEHPSLIEVDSERAQYWLGVGAQPTEPVLALLKVTGDWQKFKGLPGAEGTLLRPEARTDRKAAYQEAVKAAMAEDEAAAATTAKGRKRPAGGESRKASAGKAKDAAKDAPKDAAKEASKDAPKDAAKEPAKDAAETEAKSED